MLETKVLFYVEPFQMAKYCHNHFVKSAINSKVIEIRQFHFSSFNASSQIYFKGNLSLTDKAIQLRSYKVRLLLKFHCIYVTLMVEPTLTPWPHPPRISETQQSLKYFPPISNTYEVKIYLWVCFLLSERGNDENLLGKLCTVPYDVVLPRLL